MCPAPKPCCATPDCSRRPGAGRAAARRDPPRPRRASFGDLYRYCNNYSYCNNYTDASGTAGASVSGIGQPEQPVSRQGRKGRQDASAIRCRIGGNLSVGAQRRSRKFRAESRWPACGTRPRSLDSARDDSHTAYCLRGSRLSCVRQVLQIGLVIPVSGSSLICLLRALRVWLFGNIPPPPGGAARCVKLTHLPSVPL